MRLFFGLVKSFFIIGIGIAVLVSVMSTKFWLNFSEPLHLTDETDIQAGTIVQFVTDIEDTGFILKYSDGTPNYYFYQGSINGGEVIVFVHKNFLHQITRANNKQYTVIGKILNPEKEAVEYFGSDTFYVKLLRTDYKNDTVWLLFFAICLIGLGLVIPFSIYRKQLKAKEIILFFVIVIAVLIVIYLDTGVLINIFRSIEATFLVCIAIIAVYCLLALLVSRITKGKASLIPTPKYVKTILEATELMNDGRIKIASGMFERLLDDVPVKNSTKRNRVLLLNNLALCYYNGGDYATAENLLKKAILQFDEYNISDLQVICMIRSNIAELYLHTNREDCFFDEFNIIKSYVNEKNLKNVNKAINISILDLSIKYYDYLGEFEKPLLYYQESFYSAKNLRSKCLLIHRLYCIYEKMDDLEKQAVCLYFLEENGSELHVARHAWETLAKNPKYKSYKGKDIYSILPPENSSGFVAVHHK